MGNRYYVDGLSGRPEADGLSEENAAASWRQLAVRPGDTVLFRRGSFFRDCLEMPCGEAGAPICCGAYGEGEKPVFCGSMSLADPEKWLEIRENVWQYGGEIPSEPGNVIFEGNACGVLAWEEADLVRNDQWHYTAIGAAEKEKSVPGARFLMYSEGNPALRHPVLEAALYGRRHMVAGKRHVRFEDLTFINSGVHGYGETNAEDVTFMRCEFRMIGGMVWSRELRIRFGNGIENWDHSRDILVRDCLFDGIYDSCVTHQGPGEAAGLAVNVAYVDNVFRNYGMAAYEARDKVGLNVRFEGNICEGAGEGFSLQDETPPRRSEIWPQPMGHHLFIWRMEHGTEHGGIFVRNNDFGSSPYGAAVYSVISPEAEGQFVFEGNRYRKESGLLVRWGGRNYDGGEISPLR